MRRVDCLGFGRDGGDVVCLASWSVLLGCATAGCVWVSRALPFFEAGAGLDDIAMHYSEESWGGGMDHCDASMWCVFRRRWEERWEVCGRSQQESITVRASGNV